MDYSICLSIIILNQTLHNNECADFVARIMIKVFLVAVALEVCLAGYVYPKDVKATWEQFHVIFYCVNNFKHHKQFYK